MVAAALIASAASGLAGRPDLVWLALPAGLLAVARTRTRAGAAIALLAVGALAAGAALAAGERVAGSLPVMVVVAIGSGAVLVGVREHLEAERDVLRDYALTDPVTGISNRRSLLMRAEYEIERHRRVDHTFALLMLDLDGFKQLNDRFGHAAGDDLLRDVAGALRRAMRGQDTVARFGGDEFCVLAPETDEAGADRLVGRVTTAVRDVSVGLETVSGSAGVAIFPVDGTTIVELMHAADERLLAAKRRRPRGRARRRAA